MVRAKADGAAAESGGCSGEFSGEPGSSSLMAISSGGGVMGLGIFLGYFRVSITLEGFAVDGSMASVLILFLE